MYTYTCMEFDPPDTTRTFSSIVELRKHAYYIPYLAVIVLNCDAAQRGRHQTSLAERIAYMVSSLYVCYLVKRAARACPRLMLVMGLLRMPAVHLGHLFSCQSLYLQDTEVQLLAVVDRTHSCLYAPSMDARGARCGKLPKQRGVRGVCR
ncbi:hypothetical protein HBH98_036440 [Parastagonospora nodorum]|nr:hypothetical protein HBH53_010220 [Parastagonospora nodorum]KAH3986411.1 hypothetical protein HBH52_041420 [Parastagonospora nodorum]KAH3988088.1 hypothetical protein HBH51_007600 [Parastagonospora nodorum]KAH4040109.1 hypothetical protein HBI09_023770 [Parastagonospora nodorum]KAH4056575.1 hypothetical protein HBH49_055330 [Parastagonospora nodorum]